MWRIGTTLLLKQELKSKFAAAVKCKESGQLESAKEMLEALAKEDPSSTAILAVLADTYWDMQLLEMSVVTFKRAIRLSPKLEAVSLGLFHCLWQLKRREEALDEVKRFMSVSDSKDYRKIIDQINNEFI